MKYQAMKPLAPALACEFHCSKNFLLCKSPDYVNVDRVCIRPLLEKRWWHRHYSSAFLILCRLLIGLLSLWRHLRGVEYKICHNDSDLRFQNVGINKIYCLVSHKITWIESSNATILGFHKDWMDPSENVSRTHRVPIGVGWSSCRRSTAISVY